MGSKVKQDSRPQASQILLLCLNSSYQATHVILVTGLQDGISPTFLQRKLPWVRVTVMELDPRSLNPRARELLLLVTALYP